MLKAFEAEVTAEGRVILHEPLHLERRYRAVLTLIEPLEPSEAKTMEDITSLFGILKAKKGVSLEQMDAAVQQRSAAKFHDCD
jgi:hypothetical protein